jgi:hypothetical protein
VRASVREGVFENNFFSVETKYFILRFLKLNSIMDHNSIENTSVIGILMSYQQKTLENLVIIKVF